MFALFINVPLPPSWPQCFFLPGSYDLALKSPSMNTYNQLIHITNKLLQNGGWWLLRLGHERHCSFQVASSRGPLALREVSCHVTRIFKQLTKTHTVRRTVPPATPMWTILEVGTLAPLISASLANFLTAASWETLKQKRPAKMLLNS